MITIPELQKMVYFAKEEEKQKRKVLVEEQLKDITNSIIDNALRGKNTTEVSWVFYEEVIAVLVDAGFLVEEKTYMDFMGNLTTRISFPLEGQ